MTRTLDAEPACPEAVRRQTPLEPTRSLVAVRRPFDSITRETWDDLAGRSPWTTPFSRHAFHRAWWDAYGSTAHDETTVVIDPDRAETDPPVAIVPLMHRHEVESTDAERHTTMRHGSDRALTPVEPDAKAIFFGASYHADYATVLAAPDDLSTVSDAVVDSLAHPTDTQHPMPWDVVDLRRLRCADPAGDELAAAFGRREIEEGWTLNVEREDVCPVVRLDAGMSFDDYLGTLGKKERHEVRRKLRRAEAIGEVRLQDSPDPLGDLELFIELHQRRWGDDGLFPATAGGDASRVFFRRLFEEFGSRDALRLTILSVGDRRIAAGVHFQDERRYLYYNAGVDPDARDLSPGVLMIGKYVERALAEGCGRLDFLRGDERYKYDWGAVDEPIQRILVRRSEAG